MNVFLQRMRIPLFSWALAIMASVFWHHIATAFGMADAGLASMALRITAQSSALLASAWVLMRLLDVLVWKGVILRRTGVAAPRLLSDLTNGLIFITAIMLIIAFVIDMPVTGLVATSGVAVAVIGFALKSMISDLFSGIAITLERPFHMGDWIEIQGGAVGKVLNLSWRATGLMLQSGVYVVVPNSRLSEMVLRIYDRPTAPWRDEIEIRLDFDITAHQVERILLSAAADVPEVAAQERKSDVRITEFGEAGVKWQLRYWVPDYASRSRLRYAVQRNILRNLHFSGITPATTKLRAHISQVDPSSTNNVGIEAFLSRVPLFTMLTSAEMAELAENSDHLLVRAASAVVRNGEEGDSLFIIMEGLFEVAIPDIGGYEKIVATLRAGSFFGEMSLLTGALRTATVRAAVDSKVIEITKDALQPILARRESLMEAMSNALAERQLQNDKALVQGEPVPDDPTERQSLAGQLLGIMRSFFSRG